MKAILEFDLPTENTEFEMANKASGLYSALWDIRQKLFRPARKHGYEYKELQNLSDDSIQIIAALEEMFNTILNEQDLGGLDI